VAGAPLLLPLAQLDAADLAAARLRQLVHELDLARVPLQCGDALRVLLEHANEVIARLVARPRTTKGFTICPRSGSALPTTAFSATASCSRSALSTSNGPTRYAAVRISPTPSAGGGAR
jgi:hypothetical protein